ncbi:MAG TPA: 5-oxoprolinase subunit PxpA [Puia sp.]|nr:5-oxoprolinase subunit PxpA [Puia sp.]
MFQVDLNCDMGEGYPNDETLMSYISSVNIACGGHAGDAASMRRCIELAKEQRVAAGAHPSYPDRLHFGREAMKLSAREVYNLVLDQVQTLAGIASSCKYTLTHVKPHGALYNSAAKDPHLSHAIAGAVYDIDPRLVLFGLSGSCLLQEAAAIGLPVFHEVFADRTYQEDGSLTPRSMENALITDAMQSLQQVLQMITRGTVQTLGGKEISIVADTVCIHGDHAGAVSFAKLLRHALEEQGIRIKSYRETLS